MFPWILLLAATTPADHVTLCKQAVEADLSSAATMCDERSIKINLFSKEKAYSEACLIALKTGRQLGEQGAALPANVLAGRKRDFDAKMQSCESPAPKEDVPMRKSVTMGD